VHPNARRWAAILEIVVAFALVHVVFRSFKHFTEAGRFETAAHVNFSPGAMMILATLLLVLLPRRNPADYGLTATPWRRNLNIGLFAALLLAGGAAVLAVLKIRPNHPLVPLDMAEGIISGAGALLLTIILAMILNKDRAVFYTPWPVPVFVLIVILFAIPLAVAVNKAKPLAPVLLMVLWTVFGAGFGEEMFYRGYIQSRVDLAWGKPFRILGVNFGAGLIVSSLLFGFLHALNTVDYFHRRFDFAWGYGIQSVFAGLYYGMLRERTGSVLAGAVTHGTVDVLARIPALLK
jgi:membrane protease YdiL (CAAX protease family)